MPRKGQTVDRERWNEPFSGMSRYFIARARFGDTSFRISLLDRAVTPLVSPVRAAAAAAAAHRYISREINV